MPKTSEIKHPLKHLRTLLGRTQAQFAKDLSLLTIQAAPPKSSKKPTIGFSISFLEKIENGQKELPDDLANLLCIRYGVLPQSLTEAPCFAHSLSGEILTEASIELWQQVKSSQDDHEYISANLISQLKAILTCSFKRPLHEQSLVAEKISEFFADIVSQHRFDGMIESHFEERSVILGPRMTTVEELNSELDDHPKWKALSKNLSLNLPVKVTETRTHLWRKQGGTVVTKTSEKGYIGLVTSQGAYKARYDIQFLGKQESIETTFSHQNTLRSKKAMPLSSEQPASPQFPERADGLTVVGPVSENVMKQPDNTP